MARGARRAPLDACTDTPLAGPAIIEEFDTTIVVPPECTATLDDFGNVVIALPQATEGAADGIAGAER